MDTNVEKTSAIGDALRQISYGFYILTTRKPAEEMTTRDKDYIAAGTVCWVSQISFEPPLVMVAVQKHGDLNETVQKSQHFALNVVGKEGGAEEVKRFAKKSDIDDGQHEVDGYSYHDGQTGSPLLDNATASFECQLHDVVVPEEGDHLLLIGKVISAEVNKPDATPLVTWDTDQRYGG